MRRESAGELGMLLSSQSILWLLSVYGCQSRLDRRPDRFSDRLD